MKGPRKRSEERGTPGVGLEGLRAAGGDWGLPAGNVGGSHRAARPVALPG